jgi:hypothetical protein
MAKNTIEITNEMAVTLSKIRLKTGKKLTNQQAIEEGLKLLEMYL